MSAAGNSSDERGFTLIELLVVLAIMALALVVAAPLIGNAFPGAELRAAARDVATGLRYARSLAIARNAETTFAVDPAARRFTVAGTERAGALPDDVAVALTTARSELIDAGSGGIRFFPDGTSSGGGVELERDGRRYVIAVDWLTGHVTVRE